MADTTKKSTSKKGSTKAGSTASSSKKARAKRSGAKASAKAKASDGRAGASHEPVCTVTFCPICQAAKAGQGAGPEALGHLMAAAREFFLAAKVVVEAMPKDPAAWRPGTGRDEEGPKGPLEKIPVS